jgi:hypothetical protein
VAGPSGVKRRKVEVKNLKALSDEEKTYQLVNKAHVKRLFTNEKELQKLQEQLWIRNITGREVTL